MRVHARHPADAERQGSLERPTLLVCWRTSSTLSAYAVVIDPKAKAPIADAEGVAAVDTAWKAAGGTD